MFKKIYGYINKCRKGVNHIQNDIVVNGVANQNITINNDVLVIEGNTILIDKNATVVNIIINGHVRNMNSSGDVVVNGDCHKVFSLSGDISISGNCLMVESNGDITINNYGYEK